MGRSFEVWKEEESEIQIRVPARKEIR